MIQNPDFKFYSQLTYANMRKYLHSSFQITYNLYKSNSIVEFRYLELGCLELKVDSLETPV